jgi:hypothetical protein
MLCHLVVVVGRELSVLKVLAAQFLALVECSVTAMVKSNPVECAMGVTSVQVALLIQDHLTVSVHLALTASKDPVALSLVQLELSLVLTKILICPNVNLALLAITVTEKGLQLLVDLVTKASTVQKIKLFQIPQLTSVQQVIFVPMVVMCHCHVLLVNINQHHNPVAVYCVQIATSVTPFY